MPSENFANDGIKLLLPPVQFNLSSIAVAIEKKRGKKRKKKKKIDI